ncbi:MAG: hypothetical protein M3020_11325 [Myxococcota bacterium]|nr:hypothetical protein [Myxococcota bacterium]
MTEAEAAPEPQTKTPEASPPSRAVSPPSRVRALARRALEQWDRVLAVLAASVLALSFGFDYGADNQLIYLLKSLAIANPGILEKDWYASEVTHYHPVFAWLGAALIALNRDGWAVAITQMLLITLATTFMYETLRALAPKRLALAGFLCALPLMIETRTSSVAVSYAFDAYLQPSALGSLGLFGAIAMFVRGNFLASGIWVGIAGLFHANYLILSIPTFGLMHLFLGLKGLPRRLLLNLGPLCIAAIPVLPVIVATATSPDAARAQEILFSIRSPHHYSPGQFYKALAPFAGWQMFGVGLGSVLFRGKRSPGARFGIALSALMALVWIGSGFSTVAYVPRVVQLFVWRFAPYIDMLSAAVGCLVLVRIAVEPGFARRISPALLALAVGGLVVVGTFQTERKNPFWFMLFVVAAALLAWCVYSGLELAKRWVRLLRFEQGWLRHGPSVVLALSLAFMVQTSLDELEGIPRNSSLLREGGAKSDDLLDWMRNETPIDAVFLTPPDVDTFRFYGQRAIVVDWKSTPMVPGELVEWHRRLNDVCGRRVESRRDLRGYDELDRSELDRLKARYHLSYAVVSRGNERKLGYETVFKNHRYAVVKL